MKVEMLKWTYDAETGRLVPGRIIEVDQKTADRWIRNKIARGVTTDGREAEQADAERYAAEREQNGDVDLPKAEAAEEAKDKSLTYEDYVRESADYSQMTKKDLMAEAERRNIAIRPSMTKVDMIKRITENG